ncbi:MAG: acetyl-CoA carboxylase biotin carboxyl carrier protein, partial [Syntrophothermus sp.]
MDLELIRKLVKIIDTSGITDFSLEEGELKIKISKKQAPVHFQAQPASVQPMMQAQAFQPAAAPAAKLETSEEAKQDKYHEIRSPIVGTFYRAPSPDAEPFIK